MLERVDGARASSVVILLVAMVLVAGVLVEAARIETAGPRLARRLAGAVFVCYGILGTGYLLVRERSAAGS
jgi:hypothetical protein